MKNKKFLLLTLIVSGTSIFFIGALRPVTVSAYSSYQGSSSLRQTMLDDIEAYQESSYTLLSGIQEVVGTEISSQIYDDFISQSDTIFQNLKNAIIDGSSSSLAYYAELFAGESTEENSTYNDIVAVTLYGCQSRLQELDEIDSSFLSSMSSIFDDLIISEDEYDSLVDIFRSYDDLASETSRQEICNKALSNTNETNDSKKSFTDKFKKNSKSAIADSKNTDSQKGNNHIDIIIKDEDITSEGAAQFSLYMTVANAGHQFEYVTQVANPDLSFSTETQELDYAYFYLDCFEDCSIDEMQKNVEGYTDELIYVLTNSYPNIKFNTLVFNWKIPIVDEDSLYSATYWVEKNDDGELERQDGTGALYY